MINLNIKNYKIVQPTIYIAKSTNILYPTRFGYCRILEKRFFFGEILIYILNGSGVVKDGNAQFNFSENSVICISSSQKYAICPNSECEYMFISLKNSNSLLSSLNVVQKISANDSIGNIFLEIYLRALQNKIQNIYMASSYIYNLFMEIHSCVHAESKLTSTIVVEAMQHIQKNYAFLTGIDELTDIIGVNKSHLIRQFTAAIGISPGKYLQNIRIEHAKLMLINRDYSVENIAGMIGYSGSNYFCKVFKKHVGKSPQVFRESYSALTVDEEQLRKIKNLENIIQF